MTNDPVSILQEALSLTTGDRQDAYGHPYYNFKQTAMLLNAAFGHKGMCFSVEDIPIIMMLLKIARELHKHKRDNLVDIAGYANTLQMVHDYRETRQ